MLLTGSKSSIAIAIAITINLLLLVCAIKSKNDNTYFNGMVRLLVVGAIFISTCH